ncbi:gas vesicle protein [Streptomyces sp. NPDC001812]|uniref:Gas vesicle protein n=1 Tax=Streptomyces cathayae TaxID=3031124 RepID=A0ABY8JZZ9_9ACTN|nr:gas vesicle protein [Streptomyces sp. HUAS 5]WGD39592.1 gas vesicle protein [Streptomyces sp. HUAS 5]
MTTPRRLPEPYGQGGGANLADILERVLDKGIVIAGDIRINLLDIELLTIKLRLVVASVDKAKEMGIDWWETDPALSSRARRSELARENAELRERLAELEGDRPLAAGRSSDTDRPLEAGRRRGTDRPQETGRHRETDRPQEEGP